MKKILVLSVAALALLCNTATSHATLMETTITGTISAVIGTNESSIWTIGDGFELSVLYDDEGTTYHIWSDGPNGIAEQGGGDDTILQTITTSDLPSYSFLDDAQFSFDNNTHNYMNLLTDSTVYNYNRASFNTPAQSFTFDYYADDFSLFAEIYTGTNGNSSITIQSLGSPISLVGVTEVSFDTQPAAPIPEPATMLLFGTGLTGLAGTRLRRKKK